MKTKSLLSPKERIELTLNHKETDRTPRDFSATEETVVSLKRYLKLDEYEDILRFFHIDLRWINGENNELGAPEEKVYPDGTIEDVWGVKRAPVSYGKGVYYEICHYPLGNIKDIRELDKYPFPKRDWIDKEKLLNKIKEINQDAEYAIVVTNGNIFETSWFMRGLDRLLEDMILNPELSYEVMRRITDCKITYMKRILEIAGDKITIVNTADDIATQRGLMMSPSMWEKHIRPHFERLTKTLHEFNIKVMYHSCGAVQDAIPNLIDSGVDILDPLQFDAEGMNPEELKLKHGNRLSFHGGISVQKTLPFGSINDIKMEVIERIRILGKNGGYILAPSHAIQADTSPENILTMYNTKEIV